MCDVSPECHVLCCWQPMSIRVFALQVNDYNEWDTLAPLFGVPMACVNVGLALKQIYLR